MPAQNDAFLNYVRHLCELFEYIDANAMHGDCRNIEMLSLRALHVSVPGRMMVDPLGRPLARRVDRKRAKFVHMSSDWQTVTVSISGALRTSYNSPQGALKEMPSLEFFECLLCSPPSESARLFGGRKRKLRFA